MPRNRRRTMPRTMSIVERAQLLAEALAEHDAGAERQHSLPGCDLPPTLPPSRLQSDGEREGVDYFNCSCCACRVEPAQHRNNRDGGDFCVDCYNSQYVTCITCNGEMRVGYDYYSDDSDGPFCEGCYVAAYAHCDSCAREVGESELRNSPLEYDNARYCERCYLDRFTACCGCGRAMHYDDVAYTDEYDGDNYCAQCAPCDEDDDEAEWDIGRVVEGRTFDRVGSKRKFGVELEISGCKRHGGLRGKTPFGAKYDGSLSSGKEFVSPVLQGDEGLDAIANLCAYGRDNDWTVDSSCGYHVHIDCSGLNRQQLCSVAMGYAATADVWARFVSKSRAGNNYCNALPYTADSIRGLDFRSILDMTRERYHWVNWQAYDRHNTVEIRLHSGTTNYDKIVNWVKIHTRFVDRLVEMSADDVYYLFAGKSTDDKFTAMMDLIGDDALREYYERRAAKHRQPFKSSQPA